MSRLDRSTLRRALAPLAALCALVLAAGLLLGYQIATQATDGGTGSVRASTPGGPAQSSPPGSTSSVAGGGTVGRTPNPARAGTSGAGSTGTTATTDGTVRGGTIQDAGTAQDGGAAKAAGTASTARERAGRFSFLLMQPDHVTPIRWNPCAPVHYKVAVGPLVPVSEIAEVRAAFDTAGAALGGVRFDYQGTTRVVPNAVDDSGRAGTDVVFAFALPGKGIGRSTLLTGWEAGRGGFAAWGPTRPDGRVVELPTHGSVVIDAGKWVRMSRHDRTLLYLHEIGHVVGLDHPKDSRQVMSSGAYDLPTRYQPGDLAGLAELGRQAGCVD